MPQASKSISEKSKEESAYFADASAKGSIKQANNSLSPMKSTLSPIKTLKPKTRTGQSFSMPPKDMAVYRKAKKQNTILNAQKHPTITVQESGGFPSSRFAKNGIKFFFFFHFLS
jgi:hypothetical protein